MGVVVCIKERIWNWSFFNQKISVEFRFESELKKKKKKKKKKYIEPSLPIYFNRHTQVPFCIPQAHQTLASSRQQFLGSTASTVFWFLFVHPIGPPNTNLQLDSLLVFVRDPIGPPNLPPAISTASLKFHSSVYLSLVWVGQFQLVLSTFFVLDFPQQFGIRSVTTEQESVT